MELTSNTILLSLFCEGVLKKRSGSLQLSKLQLEDRGVYRCTANNSVGVAYRDVLLEVQGALMKEKKNKNY